MGSILELLKNVEEITGDESLSITPYAKSSLMNLQVYKSNLESSFNSSPNSEDTRVWYVRTNSVALGLEWHLAVVNEKYRERWERRQEANILFKSMQAILQDYLSKKDELESDDVALSEFAILLNETYKYYKSSQLFVWNRTIEDDILVDKIKGFMEDYNNGNYFHNRNDYDSSSILHDESGESDSDNDGSSDMGGVACDNEEQMGNPIGDSELSDDVDVRSVHPVEMS